MLKGIVVLILALSCGSGFCDKVAITEYLRKPVSAGSTVCELLDVNTSATRCYTRIDWSATLTPQSDPSHRLQKGGVSPTQGEFKKVVIGELISTVLPGEAVSTVDIYVKIAWSGVRPGTLALPLKGQHVVRGQMKMDPQGHFEFVLKSVPDLILLGTFNPTMDIAEIFGKNASIETSALKYDIESWIQDVLNAVLPPIYNQVRVNPKN